MRTEKNFVMTPQRKLILEELKKIKTHPTADELFLRLRKRMPGISLGTVYRNLELMANYGLIQKLEIASSQKRFDGQLDEHYHIRCIDCGRIDDLWIDLRDGLNAAGSNIQNYELLGHHLEYFGRCSECRTRKNH